MRRVRTIPLLLVLAFGCAGEAGRPPVVTLFAAASTTDALGELAPLCRAATGCGLLVSTGATSTLARQIEAGAPAALFLAADPEWMDRLERAGRIEPGTRAPLLGNRLAWIAPAGAGTVVEPRPGFAIAGAFAGRLALADPAHVPAGRYARAALEHLGWWEALAPRVVPAGDVRHALRLVATGACGAGIVYATDAAAGAPVETAALLPEPSHPPIVYPLAAMAEPDADTRAVLAWLRGPDAAAVFSRHGFAPPAHGGP